MTCSQHDGYHVGSMLQSFAYCGNLVGRDTIWLASKYDVKVVIPFLIVCFD
jgi:hypothetical protein